MTLPPYNTRATYATRTRRATATTMPARTHPRDETPYQIAQNPAARAAIMQAWTSTGGPAAAAEALGISRTTLYREIGRLWAGREAQEIAADLPGYRKS